MIPARWEYALRSEGGNGRILMERLISENDPDPIWHDIAKFNSYNDAERLLDVIRKEAS